MTRRAFTLLEVVLALALLIVVVGTSISLTTLAGRHRTEIEPRLLMIRQTWVLMDLLEADLATVVAETGSGEAGITGTNRELRVWRRSATVAPEQLDAVSDLRRSMYTWSQTESGVNVARGTSEAEKAEPLLRGAARWQLRYLESGSWMDEFDSVARRGLPTGLEVSVWFESRDNSADPDVRRFFTIEAPLSAGPGEVW